MWVRCLRAPGPGPSRICTRSAGSAFAVSPGLRWSDSSTSVMGTRAWPCSRGSTTRSDVSALLARDPDRLSLSQQRARDQLLHDLVRAPIDALHARVGEHAAHEVFVHVAVAAMQLHALI